MQLEEAVAATIAVLESQKSEGNRESVEDAIAELEVGYAESAIDLLCLCFQQADTAGNEKLADHIGSLVLTLMAFSYGGG